MDKPSAAGTDVPDELLRAIVELADGQSLDQDANAVLRQLAEHCVKLLGSSAASVLLAGEEAPELAPAAASNDSARRLDTLQLRTGAGPSIDAFHAAAPVLASDLRSASARWPLFVREALAEGFLSVHTIPMQSRRQTVGALALYGRATALPVSGVHEARALADVSASVIVRRRQLRKCQQLADQLQRALDSRIVIEQAKGILAQAGHIAMTDAFERLRGYSRRRDQQLSAVATALAHHDVPPQEILDGGIPHARARRNS
ncbi:GAF and ANTAR domain-containing protein [Amycolatopsis benzoatilytica]|uniref:GAF and ANTAR domain-containing protein n=1 Tax=Amycolatopsis benzoatilytica TaxID=346045 RepID=UPI0003719D4F|nr:GAF and ANTAR domain-containing protein [Amycolatopsis benzoatilytica]